MEILFESKPIFYKQRLMMHLRRLSERRRLTAQIVSGSADIGEIVKSGAASVVWLWIECNKNIDEFKKVGALVDAIRVGNLEIFRLCQVLRKKQNWEEKDFHSSLVQCAAKHGSVEVIKFYHILGRRLGYLMNDKHFDWMMSAAAEYGQIEILRLCHTMCPKACYLQNVCKAADSAASGGQIETLRLCRAWILRGTGLAGDIGGTPISDAAGWDRPMVCAAEAGHIEIMNLCIRWAHEILPKRWDALRRTDESISSNFAVS